MTYAAVLARSVAPNQLSVSLTRTAKGSDPTEAAVSSETATRPCLATCPGL